MYNTKLGGCPNIGHIFDHEIYDLDGTVIDSSHRYFTLPCGGIDLAKWFENCTREKIMRDKLLPLAARIQRNLHKSIICTARTMTSHDFDYLQLNGIYSPKILHRATGDTSGDADLKQGALEFYFEGLGYSNLAETNSIMFEDNRKVIDRLEPLGVTCVYVG